MPASSLPPRRRRPEAAAGKTSGSRAGDLVRALFGGVISCLAPPRCRCCRAPLLDHANPFLCADCAAGVGWIGAGACRGCGFPAGPHAELGGDCSHCRGKNLGFTAAAAVARYRRGARKLVLALKFGGETEIARPMAGLMAERLRSAGFGDIDWIVPASLHPARRRLRGFDQSRLLAAHLSRETGIPLRWDLLRRIRPTRPQSTLSRAARFENAQGAFAASPEIAGGRALLVDDVMTTGATLRDSARACRQAGASRVYALVFAR
ncbi:MAG: ComF family protein [Planctomycetota bacterium]|nr:ComF family protein [Planctomycetota bacterium]